MQHAKDLIAAGTKVIDLAADFRLQDLEQFKNGMVWSMLAQMY